MSKSGLFAHFGSKEELQRATIETARGHVHRRGDPARALSEPTGIERLRALYERFLVHVEERVFPAAASSPPSPTEMDTHPGPVRDSAIRGLTEEWFAELVGATRAAQAEGAIDPAEDPEQAAFELDAFLLMANAAVRDQRRRTAARSCPPRDRPPPRRGSAAVVIQSGHGGTGRSGGMRAASARLIPSSSAR